MRQYASALVLGAALVAPVPAFALTISFEDLAQAPGSNAIGGDLVSFGYLFDSLTGHSHLVNDNFNSFNGTTWAGFDNTFGVETITMSAVSGATFSLAAADFSEFFVDGGEAQTVAVTGNFFGGGSIFQLITLDGVADGAGAANDFQTELFGAAWTNLVNVTFDATGTGNEWWALDNVVVDEIAAVPEPSTWLMLGSGLALVYARRRARRG
jgi:hypothetical protein